MAAALENAKTHKEGADGHATGGFEAVLVIWDGGGFQALPKPVRSVCVVDVSDDGTTGRQYDGSNNGKNRMMKATASIREILTPPVLPRRIARIGDVMAFLTKSARPRLFFF